MEISIERKHRKEPNEILELKSISTNMKNSPGAFKNMSEKAEENIDKLKDKIIKIINSGKQKEKKWKKWVESENLWDTSKLANMINMRIQKEEERKKGAERLFEGIIA